VSHDNNPAIRQSYAMGCDYNPATLQSYVELCRYYC